MMSWLEHRIGDYFLGLNSDAHSDESALPLASLFLLPLLSLSPSLIDPSLLLPPTTRTALEAAGFFSSVAGAASFRCPLRLHIFDLSPTLPSISCP
ncbi:hypothetical protein MUK42_37167 [Musa troglodytarum]|uniref:Uncharacterized protein n=1 Tax=Musa troglodytarum TaxID=320322 RepID=A0A9E7FS14_9LILI|nr:hypothetical protein MUK42_37167 [Musa troglodytarum]